MTHAETLALLFDPIRSVKASAERLLETTRGDRRRAILLARAWSIEGGTRWQEVANLLSSEPQRRT